jgi:hypothetical protein
MLHTFQEILVCTFAYIVLVAIAYQPRPVTDTEPEAQPINYFPDVEEDDEPTEPQPKPQPIAIVERRPVAALTIPQAPAKRDLSGLGVRELYRLASQRGIKGYKKLSKTKLVSILS